MKFDRIPEKCDKCGIIGSTWQFLSIEGEPRICENCIASVLFGKKMKTQRVYLERYFNKPKKQNFWGTIVDK